MQPVAREFRLGAYRSLSFESCALLAVTALVSASCSGGGDKAPTSPAKPAVVSVAVAPAAASLPVGATQQLTATPQDAGGAALTGRTVSWNTSDGTKASVSSSGLVTAVAVGSASIVATCEGIAGSSAVTVVAGPAAAMAIRTQPSGATVGSALVVQPVIELRDARGAVATGTSATVSARIANGSGTLTGTASVSTVNGVATFTNLGINGTTGSKVLEFSATGLTPVQASPVTLAAGPAAALSFTTSPSGTAMVTVPLATQPVVQATDAGGNAIAFAGTVTAAVDSGNGAVMAGGSVDTDATGRASFATLVLGSLSGRVGTARVRVSAPGLNAAIFRVQLSCYRQSIIFGVLLASTMSANDCAFTSGSLYRSYLLTRTAAVSHVRMTVNGAFQPSAYLRGPNSPNWWWGRSAASGGTSVSTEMLLPAGSSDLAVATALPGGTGTYNVRVDSLNGDVQCILTYLGGTLTTTQQLSSGDCLSNGYYGDFYETGFVSGATLTVTVQSASFMPYVSIWQYGTPNVRVANNSGPASATVTHANTGATGVYYVYVSSQTAGGTGSYTAAFVWTYPSQSSLIVARALDLTVLAPPAVPRGEDRRANAESRSSGDRRQRP